jgi:uncharacterized protein YqjF (DUF2071 family)
VNAPVVPFLTACWNSLAFLNYDIDPEVLAPYVPAGTELDAWQGRTLVSMVGFRFTKTKLRGIAIPFHTHFTEINLRFYVRRVVAGELRRGVVFVKEVVPLPAIAFVARAAYNERYVSLPMRFNVDAAGARYSWRLGRSWNAMSVRTGGIFAPAEPNSEEEFVTEHFWGYVRRRDGSTIEYNVQHPSWQVARAADASLECAIGPMYGDAFAGALSRQPASAFFADGSAVSVLPASILHVPATQ